MIQDALSAFLHRRSCKAVASMLKLTLVKKPIVCISIVFSIIAGLTEAPMYARFGTRSASTARMKLWTAEDPWLENTISAVILAKWVLRSTVLLTSSLTRPSAETCKLRAATASRHVAVSSGDFHIMAEDTFSLKDC